MKPTIIESQKKYPTFRKLKDHSITIGAIRIPIVIVREGMRGYKYNKKDGTGGWWDGKTGSIFIMDHLPPVLQTKVLFHEMVHACNDIGLCFELTPTE